MKVNYVDPGLGHRKEGECMERRYPVGLFIIGFITNMVFHFFWLFVPGIILLIIGIFSRIFLYIGLTVMAIDIIASLIEQLRIRAAFLRDSDNPDFREFQDALSKEGDWRENLKECLDEKVNDN